jgi:hypothetical protein
MKNLVVLCVVVCIGLSGSAAFARGGGMGSHHSSSASSIGSGGASGERVGAPGTNSLRQRASEGTSTRHQSCRRP